MLFDGTAQNKLAINKRSLHFVFISLAALFLASLTGCACLISAPSPSADAQTVQAYLPKDQEPNSLTLLPPPPAQNSAAFAADQEAYLQTRILIGTPRWALAIADANLSFPEAPQAFSCALDAPITKEAMPNLYALMQRSMADAGEATQAAKKYYQHIRPFVYYHAKTCTPDWDIDLAKSGSYPSAHTTIGWTWALILAEIAPARADVILSRGYAFGQSRVICGAHWQSDVNAGRVVAAAVVAKLHADPAFRAGLCAAQKEWKAAQSKGLKPTVNCQAEKAAPAY